MENVKEKRMLIEFHQAALNTYSESMKWSNLAKELLKRNFVFIINGN